MADEPQDVTRDGNHRLAGAVSLSVGLLLISVLIVIGPRSKELGMALLLMGAASALLGVASLVTGAHPTSVAAAIERAGRGPKGSLIFALVVLCGLVLIGVVAVGMWIFL